MKKSKRTNRIPLYDIRLSPKAVKEVTDTLKSGWLSSGPKVTAFEKAICQLMHSRYGAIVSSATAGMQLALKAFGAHSYTEVITTPFTFVATVEAIMATGATPVFADIDPQSLNIDPEEVSRKINIRTLVVMSMDTGGYPSDYNALVKICKDESLLLITDAAHSIGTKYREKPVSKYTNAAVISFHATKNLICGEGGIVLSRHKKLIEAIKIMSQHGITSNAYQRRDSNKWEYDVLYPGIKANMSDVHAAIGLGQLSVFEKEQKKRKALAERYKNNLSILSDWIELPIEKKHYQHGWHLFIIKLHLSRIKINRNTFIRQMSKYGIECGVHFKPIFELTFYRDILGLSSQHFPNATYAWHRVVTLPLYPSLSFAEVDYISECITRILKKHSS